MHKVSKISLGRYDRLILEALQTDARMTHQKLSERVPLSASQIGRRIQRMEEAGLIEGYRVVLKPERIGLGVMAFAHLTLERHNEETLRGFADALAALPEVLDCYAAAGEADYLLRIVVPDLPSLSRFVMNRLMNVPLVRSVKSTIILNAVKESGALPLDHLP